MNLILALVLLLSAVFPTAFELSEVLAAEYKITWNGKVTYRTFNGTEILQ